MVVINRTDEVSIEPFQQQVTSFPSRKVLIINCFPHASSNIYCSSVQYWLRTSRSARYSCIGTRSFKMGRAFRAETITQANNCLVEFHSRLNLYKHGMAEKSPLRMDYALSLLSRLFIPAQIPNTSAGDEESRTTTL